MDRPSNESWFVAQPAQFRILNLLEVMHELTLVLREISTTSDEGLKWKSAWLISECNHRLISYIAAIVPDRQRYPDDVIVGILFDYLDHPIIERFTRHVWKRAVDRATKFGVHLRPSA